MYGLIHACVRQWVHQTYGEKVWNELLEISGADDTQTFMSYQTYPDEATLGFVGVVVSHLGIPLRDLLIEVGKHFVDFTIEKGYGEMLHTLGRDYKIFLDNLDYLHCYLMMTAFPGIVMPSFACTEVPEDDTRLLVDYYSRRPGLQDLAMGVLMGCAHRFYNLKVLYELDHVDQQNITDSDVIHHARFNVTILGSNNSPRASLTIEAANQSSAETQKDVTSQNPTNHPSAQQLAVVTSQCERPKSANSFQASNINYVTPVHFSQLHPFHFILDRELRVCQFGEGMVNVCPDIASFPCIQQLLSLQWPFIAVSYENFYRFKNLVFQFRVESGTTSTQGMTIRGEMVFLGEQHVMFLGNPMVTSLAELKMMSLRISDFPRADAARELVLLKHQRSTEFDLMQKLEVTTAELRKTYKALDAEKIKTDKLLHSMLPPPVANKLKAGEKVQESFDSATILFSDIVTFTVIASKCRPEEIVQLLNNMYIGFDDATEVNGVYKVETIGDAYMVVGGIPERNQDHARRVVQQAFDMLKHAQNVAHPITGEPVQIRVGIHSGPAVAGVVGQKMPRYCLFGDTVNVASRMESHGVPARVHISAACKQSLDQNAAKFLYESRGIVEIKGKGKMETFFVTPTSSSSVHSSAVIRTANLNRSKNPAIGGGAEINTDNISTSLSSNSNSTKSSRICVIQ